jgi:hypothetical protein
MAYGIEVFNSTGKTVFDSEHYVEIAAFTGTVNSSHSLPTTKFMIPDWCLGYDQAVTLASTTHAIITSGQSFTSVYQIRIKYQDTGGTGRTINSGAGINYNGAHVVLRSQTLYGAVINADNSVNFDNAYYVYTMSKDMTAIRGSTTARVITPIEVTTVRPTIYARPTSSSYSGQFAGGEIFTLTNPADSQFDSGDIANAYILMSTSGSTPVQFEIMVTLPAYGWGGIAGTKAHTSGTGGYGVQAKTHPNKKHTPSGSNVAFITYDSRGRPAKGLLSATKAVPAGSANNYSVISASLGSLSTSSTKRWCRMDGTSLARVDTRNYPNYQYWGWRYNWVSNNNISLKFTNAAAGSGSVFIFDTLSSDLFLAVADFGLGL